ncbi:MAG: FHA domain-containing protein [Myxococcaceae bacterium]|nr:FHA domain-containing protein [Myxococcaceae bacterium]
MAFQLVIAEGKEAGREFVFDQESVVIGRTPECDVILYDAGVSRRHARIFGEGAGFLIEDLGSSNGTVVNGSKVAKQPLKDGDSIVLGPVKFTFAAMAQEALPEEPGTEVPQEAGQHTRVVNAAELKRSRNKGVAMLPKNVNTGEREKIERRSTQMMPVISGPRPSAPKPPRASRPSGPSPLMRPDPNALAAAEDSNTDLKQVEVGGAAREQRLSAAERARLKRQGASGAAIVFWKEASRGKRLAVAGGGGLFLLLVLGLFLQAVLPEETKRKAPEANELTEQPVEQVFGVGPGVGYERVDQKVFEFELKSPVEVMVVLHYQCKDLSDNELSINVNGVDMGFAPPDTLAANEIDHELLIPARHLKRNATNTVTFDNTKNPPETDPWSLWNIWVEVTVLPEKDEDGLKADAAERYKRAEGKWEQRDIGASNRWEAYKGFREAWLFYEAMPPDKRGPQYQLAHDKMMESRRDLDNQCNKLLMQARAEFQQKKYDAASSTLDWVEKFFPTKAHPCQYRAIIERDELAATLE